MRDDQHADALVMADVVANWMVVHNAAGAVSVQLGVSVTEALIRLRAYAFGNDRLLRDVAEDIVARRLRF